MKVKTSLTAYLNVGEVTKFVSYGFQQYIVNIGIDNF